MLKNVKNKICLLTALVFISSFFPVTSYNEGGLGMNTKVYATTLSTNKATNQSTKSSLSNYVKVTSVNLNKTSDKLTVGSKDTLTATVAPSNVTNKTVNWSSTNTKVATVANGVITAVGSGTAKVTVTTADGSKAATCTVTVTAPVAKVTSVITQAAKAMLVTTPVVKVTSVILNKNTDSLTVGQWDNLYAYEFQSASSAAYKPVVWRTSNSNVATVSSSGQVTSVSTGTAIITAAVDGKTATCTVTVSNPVVVTSVTLNKTTDNLAVGESGYHLYATVAPIKATNAGIIWTTSNSKVATVDNNGSITGISVGTVTITATTANGNKKATCTITVNPAIKVASIILKKSTDSLKVGQMDYLNTIVYPSVSTDQTVTWTTSNSKIATVDDNGNVTAISVGTATITATTEDGNKTASCKITVSPAVKVTKITLSKSKDTLTVGCYDYLNAMVTPNNATNQSVKWTTSNPNVVTLLDDGGLYAVGVGTATITATTADGSKTATCAVKINSPVAVTSVALSKTKSTLKVGGYVCLNTYVYPSFATNQNVTWATSNPYVATVTSYGYVTAVGAGTATITATTADGNKTATCTIKVNPPIKVAAIALNKTSDSLSIGQNDSLYTYIYPNFATNQSVTWTTSNSNVATVSSYGSVTAVSAGTATITATSVDGSKTANCKITVSPAVKVAKVVLDKSQDTLKVGNYDYLNATVTPSNATNQAVEWTTSNPDVVVVSDSGALYAVSAGTATITATTEDGSKTATCKVTVTPPVGVKSVTLSKTKDTIKVGNGDYLSATVYPSNATNQSVTWTTSDPNIATVTDYGYVTAVSVGTATITATTADGNKTATCTITVTPPVAVTSVSLSKTKDTLTVGGYDWLYAYIYPYNAANQSLTWTTSNANVATVSSNGYVTAVSAGTVTITATTADGNKTATCTVTVNPPVAVTSIGLTKTKDTLTVGNSDYLYAYVYPSNAANQDITWTTSDIKVATVNSNGYISAVSAGTATITATSADGNKTAACTVTVNNPIAVTSVALSKTTDTLIVGGSDDLSAAVSPSNAANQDITWTTSDPKVATVNSNGYISAVSAGTATITATSVDGNKKGICTVTVNNPIAVTSVALSKTTDTLIVGGSDNLSPAVSPSNAANKDITWTTSDQKVATVNSNGYISAVSAGTATITATSVDGNKKGICTVTVNNPIAVTSVALSKTTDTLIVGGSDNLSPAVSPSNAANKDITWTTSDQKVATVNSNGYISAVSAGTATITATSVDGNKKGICTVTVNNPIAVTSVALSKTTDTLIVGGSDNLSTTVYPSNAANQTVTWTTSNSNVAIVSTNWNGATVTAVSAGTATITATSVDGNKTAIFTLTVNNPIAVTSVALSKTKDTLTVGDSDDLNDVIYPSNAANQDVTWTTSNSKVATVTSDGNVTAVSAGTAIITATSVDGSKTATCTLTVNNPIAVTSVTLDKTIDTLTVGNGDCLFATVYPSNAANQTVTWTTSNSNVAIVSSDGNVTAVGAGTATITATSVDGNKTATCTITVTN